MTTTAVRAETMVLSPTSVLIASLGVIHRPRFNSRQAFGMKSILSVKTFARAARRCRLSSRLHRRAKSRREVPADVLGPHVVADVFDPDAAWA